MARTTNESPFAIWSGSKKFLMIAVALLIVVVWGIYAYSQQWINGLSVTGMGDIGTGGGAAWGLYIVFDVYFVGISFAGITIAALIRLFNLERLKPIARMAELLTIIVLILAGLVVLIDLGQPGRGIINLLRYARPMSPFFGTFTLVISGYLFASLVYFFLDGRKDAAVCAKRPGKWRWFYKLWAAGYKNTAGEQARHRHTTWWLALFILPILVIAHSTLGLVFGLQVGRPGWFSALQAPSFVLMAGVSGIGFIIIIAAILRTVPKLRERLPIEVFSWLNNFTWIVLIGYIYFMAVEILTSTYTAHRDEVLLTQELFTGVYAGLFWTSLGLILVSFGLLFGQFLRRRYTVSLMVIAGILINLAAIGKRFLIVVPSQTHGTLLPYASGSYSPTWVEYSVILGVFAFGALAYMLFIKVFPIMELEEGKKGE